MILGLVQKARALATAGHPVIDLGIGEPDIATPYHIKAAAIAANRANDTRYTVVPGTVALRDAIVAKLKRDCGLDYGIGDITVPRVAFGLSPHLCISPAASEADLAEACKRIHLAWAQLTGVTDGTA